MTDPSPHVGSAAPTARSEDAYHLVREHLHVCDTLNFLASKGYGRDADDVARYLILRGIDDLKRAGVLRT
jgi:hypothetical protein